MREFNSIDVSAQLEQVSCPTLVLHSVHDVRVPYEEGRFLAANIPGAKFVSIDSPNHLLLGHETGWQRWTEEVRQFLAPPALRGDASFASLSERQAQILELIAQARDNAQIAATLSLSEKTVRNQVSLIFDLLGVESRAQAIVKARDAGLGKH
jgi:DNA-binding NarL/FixJ family response regulator